jgi:hypothetical protein
MERITLKLLHTLAVWPFLFAGYKNDVYLYECSVEHLQLRSLRGEDK